MKELEKEGIGGSKSDSFWPIGTVRVRESFFLYPKYFISEVALSYLMGQLGQSYDTSKSISVSAVAKTHSLETTVSWALFIWSVLIE